MLIKQSAAFLRFLLVLANSEFVSEAVRMGAPDRSLLVVDGATRQKSRLAYGTTDCMVCSLNSILVESTFQY